MSSTHAGVRLSDPSTFSDAVPALGWVSRSFECRASKRREVRDYARAERALVRPDRRIKGMGKKRAERILGEAMLQWIRGDEKYLYKPSTRADETLTKKYIKPKTVRYADLRPAKAVQS